MMADENSPRNGSSLFKIRSPHPQSELLGNDFATYILSIEQLIENLIPKELFAEALTHPTETSIQKAFWAFHQKIPIFFPLLVGEDPFIFSLKILAFGKHTHGLGRFVSDMINRWLIPGKQLPIDSHRSFLFQFLHFPHQTYFMADYTICIQGEKEIQSLKKNLSSFLQELRINILAVHHTRSVLSLNFLSLEQKSSIVKENISSLFQSPFHDRSTFDQVHNFLLKLSTEKKLSQIKETISRAVLQRPKNFDREIFEDTHYLALLFKEEFALTRDLKYISRIIGFQYILKKALKRALENSEKRFVFLKFLKPRFQHDFDSSHSLGSLLLLNLFDKTELFEKKQILEAFRSLISDIQIVKDSYVVDRREEKIFSCYLEVEKESKKKFSLEELKLLRSKLPQEFKNRVEFTGNPIFMPRNEEEILRNTVLLSSQLKYVHDIPHLSISYETQTGQEIIFTIILVRILKKDSISLKDLFELIPSSLKFTFEEVKNVGFLKKHPKESTIFKLSMKKNAFLRKDFSLDLQKARHTLVLELSRIIGEFRDYNGGMILKQRQALEKLKNALSPSEKLYDHFFENFFYSLKPVIMQTILNIETLRTFFSLLFDLYKQNSKELWILNTQTLSTDFFIAVKCKLPFSQENLFFAVNKLKTPSLCLAYASSEIDEFLIFGYVLHGANPSFQKTLQETILTTCQIEFSNKNKEPMEKERKKSFFSVHS